MVIKKDHPNIKCRWRSGETILDVMPTHSDILGFGNQWYAAAYTAAISVSLPSGNLIRVLPAPYFLATKFDAFKGRGYQDYLLSKVGTFIVDSGRIKKWIEPF